MTLQNLRLGKCWKLISATLQLFSKISTSTPVLIMWEFPPGTQWIAHHVNIYFSPMLTRKQHHIEDRMCLHRRPTHQTAFSSLLMYALRSYVREGSIQRQSVLSMRTTTVSRNAWNILQWWSVYESVWFL